MLKNTKQEQNGRSMVEMLGTLAIIGVLSVAGVAGYTTAMNKYKANEILNGASQRAMSISAQIQSGKTDPSLDEFSVETVPGASFDSVSKSGTQFVFTVSGIDATICTEILNSISTSSNVNINTGCTTFTYNNDLSAPVSNTGNSSEEESDACDICSDEEFCISNTSPVSCVAKSADCSSCQTYCVVAYSTDQDCTSDPTSQGTCSSSGKLTNEEEITDGTTTLVIGPSNVSWWTAKEYCEKYHKGLVKMSDFGCSAESTTGSYTCCTTARECIVEPGDAPPTVDLDKVATLWKETVNKNKSFWINEMSGADYAYSISSAYPGLATASNQVCRPLTALCKK